MPVKPLKKIAVLVSGGGTNLQSLIDAIHQKSGEIVVVISNNRNAFGLKRAEAAGIPAVALNPKGYPSAEAFDAKIIEVLQGYPFIDKMQSKGGQVFLNIRHLVFSIDMDLTGPWLIGRLRSQGLGLVSPHRAHIQQDVRHQQNTPVTA